MKKVFLALTLALLMFGIAACNKDEQDNHLKIAVFLGGYGDSWIRNLANDFMEENEGVTVEIEATRQVQSDITSRLVNGSDDDIFMSHGIFWERAAVLDQLEPLDDLYEMEVENGLTVADSLSEEFKETSQYNGHYYKVPYTNGVGGIIYNKKMFENNGWEVPTTYDELMALSQTIADAQIKVDPTNTKPNADVVKPFVWSQETYYWDYVVYDWWAQLAGIDKIKEYTNLTSADVFNPASNASPEKLEALDAWTDLIAKNPDWSMENSNGKQYIAAQLDFANGYAAMIPNAQWIEGEMAGSIDPDVCEMAIMPTPYLEDAQTDSEGNYIPVNYTVGFGDSIIIPKYSNSKDLAKQFIAFMARQSSLQTFTEKTSGAMLAFNYDPNMDLSNLSEFSQQVFNINQTANKFNLYSNNSAVLEGDLDLQWPMNGVQPYSEIYNHYNNLDYLKDKDNPDFVHYDTYGYLNSKYNTIKAQWDDLMD